MPIGIIVNSLSIIAGGVIGSAAGGVFTKSFKDNLNMIFGICAMTMGISSVINMVNMPAVIFSVIIGTCLGLAVHLGDLINRAGALMQSFVCRFVKAPQGSLSDQEFSDQLLTAIVLFCASGTGIYGSLVSGMNGDHTILISKSILDLFTALIFACSLGIVVCVTAIPQFALFMLLYLLAGLIFPLTTPSMIGDFKACGGVLLLATGFRMLKLKMFPLADMIPAMILVMPVSALWTGLIVPLLG